MTANEQTKQTIDALVAMLTAAGYKFDPNQILAAHHLALLAISGTWPEQAHRIANVLTPVFAQSPAQQQEIHEKITSFWPNASRSHSGSTARRPLVSPLPQPIDGAVSNIQLKIRRFGAVVRVVALTSVVLIGCGVGYWWQYRNEPALAPQPSSQTQPRPSPQTQPRPTPQTQPRPTPQTQPRPPTQIQPQPPTQTQAVSPSAISNILKSAFWSVAIPVALPLLPGFLLIGWLLRRTGQKIWSKEATKTPRDLLALQILNSDTPLFEGVWLEAFARDLRRHRRIAVTDTDINKSIDATARAGGLITLVPHDRSVTPEYVMVIEELSPHDHLARLGDAIADKLLNAGVFLEIYSLAGPHSVRSRSGTVLRLEDLPMQYPNRRLIVIGPGEAIYENQTGRISAALYDGNWADRVYIVTGLMDRSTLRRLREGGFAIVSSTPTGLRLLGRHLASAHGNEGAILERIADSIASIRNSRKAA